MRVRWYGQSAFLLHSETMSLMIDPFGPLENLAERKMTFDYPPIEPTGADILLVTHEHPDHNACQVVTGQPTIIRSRAGSFDSMLSAPIVAISSEHDDSAGTRLGDNTIFSFQMDGLRVCHLGDLGQSRLRREQIAMIGKVDLLFVPVGGGPTIDGEKAAEVVHELDARLTVPMHYGNSAVNFLEPLDAFVSSVDLATTYLEHSEFDTDELLAHIDPPFVVVPNVPAA